jgi:general secretion pathway protein E
MDTIKTLFSRFFQRGQNGQEDVIVLPDEDEAPVTQAPSPKLRPLPPRVSVAAQDGAQELPRNKPRPPRDEEEAAAGFGGGDPHQGTTHPHAAQKFVESRGAVGNSATPRSPIMDDVERREEAAPTRRPPVKARPAPASATTSERNNVENLPLPDDGRALVPADPGTPGRRRANAVTPTDEQIDAVLSYTGDVSTALGGAVRTTDKQRKVAAFLDGLSILLVHKENILSPLSMEVREQIRRGHRAIRAEYLVELDVIRRVYEAEEKRQSGGRSTRGRGGEALQQMQHEVLNLIGEAARRRASDVHVTVGRHEALVRFRADGVMIPIRQIPSATAGDICAAAFNMADASDPSYRLMDYQGARISEIRTPLPEGVQSVRLQFNPLPNSGRYLIMRLLYANSAKGSQGDVDTLGYAPVHVEQIQEMRRKPYGINIICGPTGSGKSTTLQRALTALMREKRQQISVITIEDPPEFVIPGAAQLPVTNATTDEERNEKFRAALRSDPDVIMIGEIRDKASSGLAFAAAMTGHQVWASLHANDGVSILDRFRDQGVEPYKLGDHTLITGLIGQRLIRRVCPKCSLTYDSARKLGLLETHLIRDIERVCEAAGGRLDRVRIANPTPPQHCGCREGYTGREVIAETIRPNLGFMQCVRSGDKEGAVDYWLKELNGMTMLEHSAQKLVQGLCDPRDVADKAGNLEDIKDDRFSKVFGSLFQSSPE